MANVFSSELAGDLCDAAFTEQFVSLVDRVFAADAPPYRLYVESWGGSWLEVSVLTDTKYSVFPVAKHGEVMLRGDTRRRGQCGVILFDDNARQAIPLVRARAGRMVR